MPDAVETKIQAPESSELPLGLETVNPPNGPSDETLARADKSAETLPVPLAMNPPKPDLSASPQLPSSPHVPAKTPQKPALADPLVLKIEAVERGWVLVKIDDAVIKEVILGPGETVDWTARRQFRLSLENAGGVKVEFNGKPLDPLGPRGVVVKDIVLMRE
jgi:hypothetical protein